MRANRLTYTVTHMTKCAERFKKHRRGGSASSPVLFAAWVPHMTCAMKLPIV